MGSGQGGRCARSMDKEVDATGCGGQGGRHIWLEADSASHGQGGRQEAEANVSGRRQTCRALDEEAYAPRPSTPWTRRQADFANHKEDGQVDPRCWNHDGCKDLSRAPYPYISY